MDSAQPPIAIASIPKQHFLRGRDFYKMIALTTQCQHFLLCSTKFSKQHRSTFYYLGFFTLFSSVVHISITRFIWKLLLLPIVHVISKPPLFRTRFLHFSFQILESRDLPGPSRTRPPFFINYTAFSLITLLQFMIVQDVD